MSRYWEAKAIPAGAKPTPDSTMDHVKAFLVQKYDKRQWAAAGLSPDEALAANPPPPYTPSVVPTPASAAAPTVPG